LKSTLGDLRLDKRLVRITEALSAVPMATLPRVLNNWASLKAGYRFLNNKKVTHERIIAIERKATVQRIEADAGQIILAVQDSTSFNFAGRPALSGLGVLEDNKTPGFFAHNTLAVSEHGVPLGLLNQQVWSRPQNLQRVPNEHQSKPITEKESFKWLEGQQNIPEMTKRVVTVCDREGDVYELFQDAANRGLDVIVRAEKNRRLENSPLLRDYLGKISPEDTYMVTVHRQRDQAERQAQVELRYATVTLLPPKNRKKELQVIPLQPQTLQVVEAREINPPAEVKEPIHWILLTSLPVCNLNDAYTIVRFYTYRWLVERFHYVLKSGGCHFEDSQLQTVEALHRLLAVCSQVAWHLLALTYQARQTPDAPCTMALTDVEWQALTAFTQQSAKPASAPPTLQQAVRAIAKLGGFIGRKSDGDPGVKTLWRGWQRLQDIVATWILTHPPPDMGNV